MCLWSLVSQQQSLHENQPVKVHFSQTVEQLGESLVRLKCHAWVTNKRIIYIYIYIYSLREFNEQTLSFELLK